MKRKNYLVQQSRNVKKIQNSEYTSKSRALKKIHDIFEENEIEYAISFSGNLFLTGIVSTFNDIDVAIHFEGAVENFNEILIQNNISINYEKIDGKGLFFPTDLFINCTFEGVQIEIYNGDFQMNDLHFANVYGNCIPLMPIELMFIQYAILEEIQPEKRRYKRQLIEEYLENTEILNRDILDDAVYDESLSLWIRKKCRKLLTNS